MKTTRLVIIIMVIGMFLSACAVGELIPAPTMTMGTAPASTATPVVKGIPSSPDSGLSSTPDLSQSTNFPAAVQAAERGLSDQLGLDLGLVKVVRYESVDWPDGCLGIQRPGIMCTTVIVPGYRVILQANGKDYEYHTNANGSAAVLYPGNKLVSGLPITATKGSASSQALAWHVVGGLAGLCQDLSIDLTGQATAATCAGGQSRILGHGQLTEDEMTRLNQWLSKYQSFQLDTQDPAVADSMSVHLSFIGFGSKEASSAEQQTILTFAQDIFNRISS